MPARAIWKGSIRFGSADVPVKLFSAVEDRGLHLRMLDKRTREPVTQEMVDPRTDEVVAHENIRRAYEAERGRLVVVDDDEIEAIQPEPSRDIEITRFVPAGRLTHQWYDRPYYLAPDAKASKTYFALAEALRKAERIGIARWVMRKKEYVGALLVEGDYLMLVSLRYAEEVVPASALKPPAGREAPAKALTMAYRLIEALEAELDLDGFTDEYRDRVVAYAKAKARGRVKRLPKPTVKRESGSLETLLARSLQAAERASA